MDAQAWYNQPQQIQVSPGEYFDRWTILAIKLERVQDDGKRAVVREELDRLGQPFENNPAKLEHNELKLLVQLLRNVNEQLWDVEDHLRLLEQQGRTGSEQFTNLARSVYKLNDKRSHAKQKINLLCKQPGEIKELPTY